MAIFDDQDPAHVTYNGTWLKGGTPQNFQGTLTSSTNVGDFFTVKFNGDSIRVFTTIDATSGGVITSYSADEMFPEEVATKAVQGRTLDNLIWQSPTLPAGDHSLKVQMVKVNNGSNFDPGEGTVWFDYFIVGDPAPTASPQPSSPPSPTHSKSIAAVAGGTMAGAIVICATLLFRFVRVRRRRNR